MILEQEIREECKEVRKIPYPGQFYGSQISFRPNNHPSTHYHDLCIHLRI